MSAITAWTASSSTNVRNLMNCLLSIMITTVAEMAHFQKHHSGHVYILHGTMTMADNNYLHPLVLFHLHLLFLHVAYVSIDASYRQIGDNATDANKVIQQCPKLQEDLLLNMLDRSNCQS